MCPAPPAPSIPHAVIGLDPVTRVTVVVLGGSDRLLRAGLSVDVSRLLRVVDLSSTKQFSGTDPVRRAPGIGYCWSRSSRSVVRVSLTCPDPSHLVDVS